MVTADPLLDPGRDFPNYQNVYRRDLCGDAPDEALLPVHPTVPASTSSLERFTPELQGASADGGAAIVRVRDKLTEEAPANRWLTYYADEGDLKLLCVLPNGAAVAGNCSGGTGVEIPNFAGAHQNRPSNVTNAISDDGNRVYWTDSGVKDSGAGKVYLRIDPGAEQSEGAECEAGRACTVEVSGTKSTKAARFLTASPDGSKALFEVVEGALEGNLYLFDAGAGSSSLIAEGVVGLAAASEDLSRIYFVSEEDLADGATAGEPNLYLTGGGEEAFIATLSQTDVADANEADGGVPSNTERVPIYHAARTTPDGSALAFISNRSLTGYDNADLVTGTPNSEVYLYRAGSPGPLCVSCNPSGQRPRGELVKGNGNVPGRLAAAALLPTPENMLYTQRALSEDGSRLFFESFDSLLPRDVNGAKDVYEWASAESKAGCQAMGAELYVPQAGGCISLISSGESPQDSEFLDASASGDDVFFITNAGLLPQDPGLYDLYDARVGGGLPLPPPIPECQGESCKPPVSAPEDPTPASSAYVGPGDLEVKATPRRRCGKGKRRVRRGAKQRCVKKRKRSLSRKRGGDKRPR